MAGNDIERAIGRLEQDAASSQRQREELFKQVGQLREDMHAGFKEIRDLVSPFAHMPKHIERHCEDLKVVNNYIQRFKGVMWSGRMVWAVLLVLVGAGWAVYAETRKDLQSVSDKTQALWGYFAPVRDK